MTTQKLFEILSLVNGVRSRQWQMVRQLVKQIGEGGVTVKTKRWNDDWKQNSKYYPLDLTKIETWSTFDDTCIDLQFRNDGQNNLVCEARIYDGDSFNGHRQRLRFEATLLLPTKFLQNIEPLIKWAFDAYLEDAHIKYLEEQKQKWIAKKRADILNNKFV